MNDRDALNVIPLVFGRVEDPPKTLAAWLRRRLRLRRWAVQMHDSRTGATQIIDGLWDTEFSARVWRDLCDADRGRRFDSTLTFEVVRAR